MKYREVVLKTTVDQLDALSLKLRERGIEDLILSDPRDLDDLMAQKEATRWDYIDESVLRELGADPSITFYADAQTDTLDYKGLPGISHIEENIVDDQDWLHRWKDYFEPAPITERFVIKPAWSSYQPGPGEQVIEMDPGMAFGTGTHATTRLCLRLLEKYLEPGDAVLDVGTGTGILSIAAAKLGSKRVLAVDIDPLAIETARENIAKNHVEKAVTAVVADLAEGIDFQADVVIANLMADLIIRLSGSVKERLTEKGIFISGGIIQGKEISVQSALESSGFQVTDILQEDEWWAIAAKRPQ